MADTERMKENTAEPVEESMENPGYFDDIEVVIGDNTIKTRQPDQQSRHRRHWEQHVRHRRMMITLGCVIAAAAILFSLVWYFYSPIYGYGDLSETVSSDMINMARSRFTVEDYHDKKEGVVLSYNIFIPYEYDRSKHYPLILCLADDAWVGLDTTNPLNHNFGGAIWAIDRIQKEHPCFVVVPCYPEKVTGSGVGTFTRYTDITARMLDAVVHKYNVNATDVFGTGQGMGASMLLYLAADDPDRFRSLLLVDGGAEIPAMTDLSQTRFVYFAAEGDDEALEGQRLVQDELRHKGIEYAELTGLDAGDSVDELNTAAEGMLDQGMDHNFITWRRGSVGWSLFVGEQRISYRFGYKIESVLDWMLDDHLADFML